jgi:hypothetical protein
MDSFGTVSILFGQIRFASDSDTSKTQGSIFAASILNFSTFCEKQERTA